ncbi:MAG: class I SAM-dependent methyltransferase [Candidatus Omnitrophota bacterium]|jgi:ubiquinone/menaquinone biosynthesis C-methylase UbiE|nr:MAG: class I SAM-dependent methyltransferase [Candidatus Omnitrophota bacterium]
MSKTKEKKTIKEKAYEVISKSGIAVIQKIFPEYFAKQPLRPTDRYIEYSFATENLPSTPAKILDVGCAGSFFPLLLAGFGYQTYGLDIREYAITNKISFKNFNFVKESVIKTSFQDNFFDAITAISTLEHIGISGRHGEKEDLQADKKALAEMVRILKNQGTIILTIPFGKAKIIRPYARIYDSKLVEELIKPLKIVKDAYFMIDESGDWAECSRQKAETFDATEGEYPLCLLKLLK